MVGFAGRRLNARLRDELLNEDACDGLGAARKALAIWRHDYKNVRPHYARAASRPRVSRALWGLNVPLARKLRKTKL
jgi:hypothetical protein